MTLIYRLMCHLTYWIGNAILWICWKCVGDRESGPILEAGLVLYDAGSYFIFKSVVLSDRHNLNIWKTEIDNDQ